MRSGGQEASAAEIIASLGLARHPEGGWYAETWRAAPGTGGRGSGTAIYFLLCEGEVSAWHRVDATEIWHHYGGAPIELVISADGVGREVIALGPMSPTARPQAIVPPGAWQMARSTGAWTLVGCTVSPAFEFEGFELAPPGWEPGAAGPPRPRGAS